MKINEARQQFVAHWGIFAGQWGINRTMAQVHALLLIAEKPLSTDDVMTELNISRGNANMNIRDLIDWQLVHKKIIPGDRKEYFSAEKDIWKVATHIMQQRKKRELDPMVKLLDELSHVENDKRNTEVKSFIETVNNIKKFSLQVEKMMSIMIKSEENWFWGSFLKVFKK
jgi:DNA-binding transcriptional regulator GbsR (MarR family)